MARIERGASSDASDWVERLARAGFVAKGVLYATVGTLAACAGLGSGGETTDTRGAMDALIAMPFGEVLLLVMALGLTGYAVWRIIEGIVDRSERGSDAKGIAMRASFIVRGLIHLALAVTAVLLALRMPKSSVPAAGGGDGGAQAEEATATALEIPGGRWLVLGVALAIVAFGLYQVIRALKAKLSKDVSKAEVKRETGRWVIMVSRFGIAARGLVFAAVGWLLGRAALEQDAEEAGGLAPALDVFADIGRWPLIAIALGLISYGFYQFLCARYRRIRS